jgi:hypothetical protein
MPSYWDLPAGPVIFPQKLDFEVATFETEVEENKQTTVNRHVSAV